MTALISRTGFQSSRRMFRHTFPSRLMFGWYIIVSQSTFSGIGYGRKVFSGQKWTKWLSQNPSVPTTGTYLGRLMRIIRRNLKRKSVCRSFPKARVWGDNDVKLREIRSARKLCNSNFSTVKLGDVFTQPGDTRWIQFWMKWISND